MALECKPLLPAFIQDSASRAGWLPKSTCIRDLAVPSAAILAQALIPAHLHSDGQPHTLNSLPALSLAPSHPSSLYPKVIREGRPGSASLMAEVGSSHHTGYRPLPVPDVAC